jgi:hypothetical protein
MTKTILLRRRGSAIATARGIKALLPSMLVVPEHQIHRHNNIDILIRWRSKEPCQSRFEINTIDMINRMDSKKESRRFFQEIGISVPKSYFSKEDILSKTDVQYPLLGRKKYHSQGKGIEIIKNKNDVLNSQSEYWSEYIQKDREYRVYVFMGKIIGISEKIPEDKNSVAWNNSLGNAVFKTIPWNSFNKDMCNLVLDSTSLLDVDFSAVDVIEKDGTFYIIELNSAPTLSGYRQTIFARAFSWLIKTIEETGTKPYNKKTSVFITKTSELIHPSVREKLLTEKQEETEEENTSDDN